MTIADLQDAEGQRITEQLVSEGCHATYVRCNVTDWTSSVKAFKHAASFSPSKTLDVAALFAGTEGGVGSLTDQVLAAPVPSLDEDAVPLRPGHRAIDVNLRGQYENAWLALHYMRLPSKVEAAKKTKSLILTSSMSAYVDMPTHSDYNASKCKSTHQRVKNDLLTLTLIVGVRGLFRGLRHTT